MPVTVEHLRPFQFTQETASQAGQRSGEVRRTTMPRRRRERVPRTDENAVKLAVERQLRLVAEQIAQTRTVLNDTDYRYCEHCERAGIEPHHRAQLLKSLDTLLDRQRKLLGIPDPANAKVQAPSHRSRSRPEPTPIEPPCGPEATTGGGGQAAI